MDVPSQNYSIAARSAQADPVTLRLLHLENLELAGQGLGVYELYPASTQQYLGSGEGSPTEPA